jgi:DNA-directed RNA polymerase II subunit RPB1
VYINYHNTSILADRMTCKKDMVSMSKSGLLSDDTGTLAKASFEAHSKVLLQSAQHGNIDYMKGISASVFVGSTGFYGTSAFSITLDMKKLETLEDVEDVNVVDAQKEIEAMFGRSETAADECSRKNVGVSTNIAHIKAGEMESLDDDYSMGF